MLFLVEQITLACACGSVGAGAGMQRADGKGGSSNRGEKKKHRPPALDTRELRPASFSVDDLDSPDVRSLPPSPPPQSWHESEVRGHGTHTHASTRMHEIEMQARHRGDSVTRKYAARRHCVWVGRR
jgi:hypothetical protein